MSQQEVELYHFPYTNKYAIRDEVTGELYDVTLVTKEEEEVYSDAEWREEQHTQALCILPLASQEEETYSSRRYLLPAILVGIALLLILATGGTLTSLTTSHPVPKPVKSSPPIVNQTTISQQAKILAQYLGIPQDRWHYVVLAWNDALSAGIDPTIFVRQINQESGFQVVIRSNMKASGIAQIIPSTAQEWGVDPTDPVASLRVAAEHMAWYVHNYGGSYTKALTCYNGGCGWIATCTLNGVFVLSCLPRETRNYIYVILGV